MKSIITLDNFYSDANKLRNEFENNFKAEMNPKRFVWDNWFIEDQYHLIRTPAYLYFSKQIYNSFHGYLVEWGRQNLGCHDISPPWLSYYTNGHYQNTHADLPHGPWAFVFSISPKKLEFSGGETLIATDELIAYWKNFYQDFEEKKESARYFSKIKSRFNRLIVFDPRRPHGVSRVNGVENPTKSRLVIHGWFIEPRPYVIGALSPKVIMNPLAEAVDHIAEAGSLLGEFHGVCSLRLLVNAKGGVLKAKVLTNNIVGFPGSENKIKKLNQLILETLLKTRFSKSVGISNITIPLIFK